MVAARCLTLDASCLNPALSWPHTLFRNSNSRISTNRVTRFGNVRPYIFESSHAIGRNPTVTVTKKCVSGALLRTNGCVQQTKLLSSSRTFIRDSQNSSLCDIDVSIPSEKIFEIEPETKLSHIQKFFKLYKQIFWQKLIWSMQKYAVKSCIKGYQSMKSEDDQKASSLKDLDIKFYVIGLGNKWVHNQFYKDLEMLSRKTDIDVYRMTSLMDLVQQIKAPKRRCLQTKSLSKATNQVLSRSTYFKGEEAYKKDSDSDKEELYLPFVILEKVNLETKEPIGDMKLRFTQKELHRIKHIHPPAIKIIGVRPIHDDLFRYHIKRKYFVRADYGSTRKGNKSEALLHYDTQNCITDKQVALWKRAIDRLDVNYHMFKSYKLECQIQIVEKLALDKELGPPPIAIRIYIEIKN
ncbi:ATP-dependent DNA helicase 2 subunit 1 [Temnothorax longispinosus]|uniref:ATP-dependent DNA helicase 2 subunit 1 n=1 Tax=Temnothorax longispinosus TaxID=300112 RepID=A0A4S2KDG8_9HYME|nr:ATP-dependent DNA helicase 2 subunit 1 [Temnothorax longispinosus]